MLEENLADLCKKHKISFAWALEFGVRKLINSNIPQEDGVFEYIPQPRERITKITSFFETKLQELNEELDRLRKE